MKRNNSVEFPVTSELPKSQSRRKSLKFDARDRSIFGLCTYEEIEEQFKNFCLESPYKGVNLQRVFSRLDSKTPQLEEGPNVKNGIQSEDPTLQTPQLAQNQSKQNISKPKTVEFSTSWQQLDPVTLELLREFGVAQTLLSSFQTEEEREKYIIDCMKRKLDEDMEHWKKEVEFQEKGIEKFEKLTREKEERMNREKDDIFKWLAVKTDFPSLRKKLKSNLMTLLNDVSYQNQKKLEKTFLDMRGSQDSVNRSKRIVLEHNVPDVSTPEILMDILGENDKVFKMRTHSSRNLLGRSSIRTPAGHTAVNISGVNTIVNLDTQIALLKPLSKRARSIQIETKNESAGLNYESTPYVWDGFAEDIFKEQKEAARARMFRDIKSSSWNEVGLSPFVVTSHFEQMSKTQRHLKLEQYKEGHALPCEDYNYLANTSKLLNNYSDKQFIQAVVNNLEPEILGAVETDLAQEVLHEYDKTRSIVKNARVEYLNNLNKRNKEVVQENKELAEQLQRVKEGTYEQQKMRKKMIIRLEQYEKKKAHDLEQLHINPALSKKKIGIFMKKLMQPIKDKVTKRRLNSVQYFIRKNESEIMDVKASKRVHHPSSKIILDPETRNHDFMGLNLGLLDPKLNKRKNENLKDFKLKMNSSILIRNPYHFKKYYAGGPIENDVELESAYYTTEFQKFKGTELEHKAATFLKAQLKGFVERALFRFKGRRQLERLKSMKDNFFKTPGRRSKILVNEFFELKENKERKSSFSSIRPHSAKGVKSFKSILGGPPSSMTSPKDFGGSKSFRKPLKSPNLMIDQADDEPPQQQIVLNPKMSLVAALKGLAKSIIETPETREPSEKGVAKAKEESRKITGNNVKDAKISSLLSIEDQESFGLSRPLTAKNKQSLNQVSRPQTAKSGNKPNLASSIKMDSQTSLDTVPNELKRKSISTDKMAPIFSGKVEKRSDSQTPTEKSKFVLKQSNTSSQHESARIKAKETLKKRVENVARKAPTKGLLIKQRKLMTAARLNNFQLIRGTTYLYYEEDVNSVDEQKNTPLYYSAKNGNLEFCQFLLDRGARVNVPCENGNTPLHMAFYSNKEAVIILLLINGGNLNTLNHEGLTPLAFGSERVLTLLDLKTGTATYTPNDEKLASLPSGLDNNYLLSRGDWKKPKEDDTAVFKYKALESPTEPIRQDAKYVATYMQPGTPLLEKFNIKPQTNVTEGAQ